MNLTGTWPVWGDAADPFEDEFHPSIGFVDYGNAGGTLRAEDYAELVALFRAELSEVRTGRVLRSHTLVALASQLLLDVAPDHERRFQALVNDHPIDHETLARIATDLCPAGASEALDRLLGPLAQDLDPSDARHRATALAALAAFCFTRPDGAGHPDGRSPQHGRTPFEQWCRRKPLPPADLRATVRALARAPMGVWSLERATPEGWVVADRLGLAPHVRPAGPVRFPELASPFRPPRAGDTVLARIAPTPAGWTGSCAIALPGSPPNQRLRAWSRIALWEQRLLHRRLTLEDLQRRSAHTVSRRVVEWAWLHGDDDPYRDPVLYDLEYSDHDEDVRYYAKLAAQTRGPILELGCGTGRLTLAMARAGATVDGVDLSQPMLDQLDARRSDEAPDVRDRIRSWQADFRTVESDRQYALIVWPFNALHHCRGPEDVGAVLARAEALLSPGGRLAVDCYLPALELYDRDPAARIEPRDFVRPDTGETVHSWEQGWWDPELQLHHVMYVYKHPDGTERHTHLQLRMYSLDQLHAMFRGAGWTIRTQAQDFSGAPLTSESMKWVATLER